MEQQPLVSVIINCYNGEKYLREAIDSVIAQTYTNWEIIFWDNQSTDGTAEIVKSYKDDRIRYFYAPEHTPLGEARNLAMDKSCGKYISFLDSDDIWLSTKLEVQTTILNKELYGLVYTDYQTFGTKKNKIIGGQPGERTMNSLLADYDIAMSSAIFDVELIEQNNIKFNDSYQLIEDLDFFTELAKHTRVFHVPEVLVKYRVHQNNLSNIRTDWHLEYEKYLCNLYRTLSEEQLKSCKEGLEAIERRYYNRCYSDALLSNRNLDAIKAILKIRPFKVQLMDLARLVMGKNISEKLKIFFNYDI